MYESKVELIGIFIDELTAKPIARVYKEDLERFSPRKIGGIRCTLAQSGVYLEGNFLPNRKQH